MPSDGIYTKYTAEYKLQRMLVG